MILRNSVTREQQIITANYFLIDILVQIILNISQFILNLSYNFNTIYIENSSYTEFQQITSGMKKETNRGKKFCNIKRINILENLEKDEVMKTFFQPFLDSQPCLKIK